MMFDILQYAFFRNALWAVLLIGIAGGIIGTYIVTRRMVFITAALPMPRLAGSVSDFFSASVPRWEPCSLP